MESPAKPLIWIASSRDDLKRFPVDVRRVMGQALDDAQRGGEHPRVKALHGFGGRNVLEIVDDHDGDTYRAIYTVRFSDVIYVLHAFQKESKRGRKTAATDINLVKIRLRTAEAHHQQERKK